MEKILRINIRIMKKFLLFGIALTTAFRLLGQQVFNDFQVAARVVGQPGFETSLMNYSDSVTYGPTGVAVSSKGMLAVAEQFGGSVKIWYSLPEKDGQPADVEVGNPGFSTNSYGPSRQFAESFDGVAWSPDGNKLIATCGSQNRVLIWNSIPNKNGQPADVVLGQQDFNSMKPGTSQTALDYPCAALVTPSGKLLVSDYYNNRVMVWNTIPDINGAPADLAIGQSNFNSNKAGDKANELSGPRGLALAADGRLLIACASSNQVVVYDSIPESFKHAATVVIGHTDFKISIPGTSDSTMLNPFGLAVTPMGQLATGEFGNNRVMVYNGVPREHGAHADHVLGQPGFFTGKPFAPSGSPYNNNFNRVYGISSDLNGRLYVSGRDMNRVMVFGQMPADTAELAVNISVMDTMLCEMSRVLFQVSIVNNGPDTAFNVVSTTALPRDCALEGYIVYNGSYHKGSGCWSIPVIAPGKSAGLLLQGSVNPGTGGRTLSIYANITGSSALDNHMLNNGTSVNMKVYALVLPESPVVNNESVCSGSRALLSSAGSDPLLWFAGEHDIFPLAAGSSYLTDALTEDATYFVEARNMCSSTPRVPVQVSIWPVYSREETVFVCSGDGYVFPDGWTETGIADTVVHTSHLTSAFGCDSLVTTTVMALPVYSAYESDTLCSGESYTFPDGTVQHDIVSSLTHTSRFTSVTGCDSLVVTTLFVRQVDASVSGEGTYLKAHAEGASYQWIDAANGNMPIPGETKQDFVASQSGSYAVIVNTKECSATSEAYPVTVLAIDNKWLNNPIIGFPNPVRDVFTLRLPSCPSGVKISIFSPNSQCISTYDFRDVQEQVVLNLQELRPGYYMIRVSTGHEHEAVLRIVKE